VHYKCLRTYVLTYLLTVAAYSSLLRYVTFDLSSSGFLVQSLDVSLFADFKWSIDETFDETQTGQVMQLTSHVTVLHTSTLQNYVDCILEPIDLSHTRARQAELAKPAPCASTHSVTYSFKRNIAFS